MLAARLLELLSFQLDLVVQMSGYVTKRAFIRNWLLSVGFTCLFVFFTHFEVFNMKAICFFLKKNGCKQDAVMGKGRI